MLVMVQDGSHVDGTAYTDTGNTGPAALAFNTMFAIARHRFISPQRAAQHNPSPDVSD